jgi:glycosyltransferase involved in cell wall biosynthesis
MKFSIIIPSFNQENYIQKTLENVITLRKKAIEKAITIEILLFDNESNEKVRKIIVGYESQIDYLRIEKDNGQYDAINKGIESASGEYWTWLNTDDLLDLNGFFKQVEILKSDPNIDYIYGNVCMVNEKGRQIKIIQAKDLNLKRLIGKDAGIFQPGSFFKRAFTNKIGLLKNYECCFDYEYILRLLKSQAQFYKCDFTVSAFRYHQHSKSGNNVNKFIDEELVISKSYGRKTLSKLSFILHLRKLKRRLLN